MLSRSDSQPTDLEQLAGVLDPWWVEGALRAIADLADSGSTFSSDNLRADPLSLPEPSHPGHWGILFQKAKANGLIEPAGFTVSATPSRKGGSLRVWRAPASPVAPSLANG